MSASSWLRRRSRNGRPESLSDRSRDLPGKNREQRRDACRSSKW